MNLKTNIGNEMSSKVAKLQSLVDKTSFWKGAALILFGIIILTQLFEVSIAPKISFLNQSKTLSNNQVKSAQQSEEGATVAIDTLALTKSVLPAEGVALPIKWGDLGKRMVADGVIDEGKFRALFEGGLGQTEEQMMSGNSDQPVVMNEQNSRYLLDMLWAFGLANKNDILDKGEMVDEKYGGAENFASTGGWSLAKGAGFDHYSMHEYVSLSPEEQKLVDTVSRGIYRPCCGNSTHFPDCNHGMAMLGLLELMAKNGVSEKEMYDVALKVNSFWFPQTYIDLATYFEEQGQDWDQVDAKTALSAQYSSSQGYQQTRQNIKSLPKPASGNGGCGA